MFKKLLNLCLIFLCFGLFSNKLNASGVSFNKKSSKSRKYSPKYKHQAKLESAGKLGNKRNIGDGKILIPVWQSKQGNKVVFTDFRGRFDNFGSSEFNIGLGYRNLIDYDFLNQQQWVIGAYFFVDKLNSQFNNEFWQSTIGIEALSDKYDFRANIYLPEDNAQNIKGSESLNQVGNSNFVITSEAEKAYDGIDFEIGYKLPFNLVKTKAYAGYYYFDETGFEEEGYKNIAGSKLRIEFIFDNDDHHWLPKNTQMRFGAEHQSDDVQGEQVFATAKFTYSFGKNANIDKSSKLMPRMTEFPERDIDIKSSSKKFNKDATIIVDDREFDSFTLLSSNDDLASGIENAGENSLIVLDGSNGNFILDQQKINLNKGQVVISDRKVIVKGGNISFEHDFNITRAAIKGGNNLTESLGSFVLNDDVILDAFDLDNIELKSSDIQLQNLIIKNLNMNFGDYPTGIRRSNAVSLNNVNNALIDNVAVVNANNGFIINGTRGDIEIKNSSFTTEGNNRPFVSTALNILSEDLLSLENNDNIIIDNFTVNSPAAHVSPVLIKANIENLTIINSKLNFPLRSIVVITGDIDNLTLSNNKIDAGLSIGRSGSKILNISGSGNLMSEAVCESFRNIPESSDDFECL